MAELSKITLPNNVTYDIKDTLARDTRASLVVGTEITANSDLNDTKFQKVGSYACFYTANVSSITNKPSDLTMAFMMTVYSPLGGASSASVVEGNWIYRVQEIMEYTGSAKWARLNTTNGSGVWSFGTWKRVRFTISDSVSTTSSTTAASSTAVKTAYDLANNAKPLQTAVSSPTASGSTTSFIDTISQNANGVITATKKNLDTSGTWSGNASKLGTSTVGSSTKPIYLNSGTATECSTYAGGTKVTLNNSDKGASTASFYAPTAGGTANTQALVGNGATTAPKWVNISPSISITAGTASAAPKINTTVLGQSGTAQALTIASTSVYGVTKLSSATDSTSTALAATPSAVKTAYDLANSANTTANSALSGVQGGLIYDHTFTISNGIATFTPHVYRAGSEVTTEFAKSCFTWKYRLINGNEVNLTTKDDRGCDVTISQMGYGGHVIGIFNPGT